MLNTTSGGDAQWQNVTPAIGDLNDYLTVSSAASNINRLVRMQRPAILILS